MARTLPQNPLSRLINARMAEMGITRTDLVERMGFQNLEKGLRRLDTYLATGQDNSQHLRAIPDVLDLDTTQIEAADVETQKQIAEAEEGDARERFRPHILALTNGVRSPFFIQAVAWHQKVTPLPKEIAKLSSSKQVRKVAELVRHHFHKHQGMLGVWGKITGYRLQRTYDHAVLLNVDGTVRDGFLRRPEPPAPEILIGGRRVPVGVFGEG